MDKNEYLMVQNQILLIAGLVRDMPLTEFITAIGKAEALGPIIDPTLWIKGNKNMDIVKSLAVKLQSFQAEVLKQKLEKESVDAPA